MRKIPFIIFIIISYSEVVFSQSIPVGSYAESVYRRAQLLTDQTGLPSFAIRSINSENLTDADSSLYRLIGSTDYADHMKVFSIPITFNFLTPDFLIDVNPTRPYGYNNGTLFPNVGTQARASAGFFFKAGVVNLQFKPEFVTARNANYGTFAEIWYNTTNRQLLGAYYSFTNNIDAPERFGNKSITKIYPGQSRLTLNYKGIELGVSTENIWWGPGVKNSIMMSNSAPGFLHWTINSAKPLKTAFGAFEWQLIGGRLKQSGYPALDTGTIELESEFYRAKPKVDRYLSGFTVNWQPKWLKGLYIGFSGYNYMDVDSAYNSRNFLKKTIPVFLSSGSENSKKINNTFVGDRQDYAYSMYLRQLLPAYHAELYFEYARNDRASSLDDFLAEPEHASAYTLGFIKLFKIRPYRFFQLKGEWTKLERAPTYLVRDAPSWYVHSQSPLDGYTNQGRYLGAGIGPGSNSLMVDFSYIRDTDNYGINVEKLTHNNDLYYSAFKNTNRYNSNWVDFATTAYATLRIKKQCLLSAELTRVYSLNYEYYKTENEELNHSNFYHFRLTMAYLF